MLNITTIKRQNVGKVVGYYADSADDYYAKDGSAMQWHGKGAEALGLAGAVEQSRFAELLNGRINERTQLRRTKPSEARKERLGYDLTFSAPKGVSLQALVHGDARIIAAHDSAVAAALREAEMLAAARSTLDGKTSVEHTHKLVAATFRHETSREVDSDLHTHAFVLNMTQRANGEWRALVNDGIVNSLSHLGNVYKAELAKALELQGFKLKFKRNGTFDLAHFTEHQISEFSARRNQIDAKLAEWGLSRESATPEQRDLAAMQTRERKSVINREGVRESWLARAKELGIDFDRREWAGVGNDGPARSPDSGLRDRFGNKSGNDSGNEPRDGSRNVPAEESGHSGRPPQIDQPLVFHADQTVKFAIQSLTERQAIVTREQLLAVALRHGYGRLIAIDIRAAIDRAQRSGHLIQEEALYRSLNPAERADDKTAWTGPTGSAMPREKWIAQLMGDQGDGEGTRGRRTREQARALVDAGIAQGRLEKTETRYTTHIAQRRERDILALESAGRGAISSRVTAQQIDAYLATRTQTVERAGLNAEQARAVARIADSTNRFMAVPGFAGVGKSYMTKAAKELLEQQGYSVVALAPYGSQKKALESEGIEARTLQSFLKAKNKKLNSGTVVFVDEAGVIPARQMLETMKIVEAHHARVVFLGDTAQTKAIEAGKPFEQLLKAGMQSTEIRTIQRQKDPELLKAVELAAVGKTADSLAHVTRIHEVMEAADRYAQIVKTYADLSPVERVQTLVITGTNQSRKAINDGIQQALGLKGTGRDYTLLDRLDTTQAERRHSKYYEKGAVIIPERDYAIGLCRGEQYEVLDTGPGNRLTVRAPDGAVLTFSPARTTQLSVYRPERIEVAVGDQIKVTRNDKDRNLANGDRLTVREVRETEIVVESHGRSIKLDATRAMYAALAYASTVHSAQGLTSDKVLINLDTRSLTTAKDVYYVAVSRARYEAEIFTDNRARLPSAVLREATKTAALELNQLKHWIEQGHGKSGPPIEGQKIRAKEKAAVGPDMGIGQ
ncbi:MobF family relaxase [Caballeronia sp. LP006]|uniref:MobF family relaxase n=1 Tax=Caballeronia sp. LP006 TaxID=3038552 RepID=UPI00285BC7DD|nr:MobF family relaxase [Caballeronia sp. LP006]MDR5826271.1 MobF family relaxase [Caballeronia sp. LP006]